LGWKRGESLQRRRKNGGEGKIIVLGGTLDGKPENPTNHPPRARRDVREEGLQKKKLTGGHL